MTRKDAISKASVFEILGNLMGIPYELDRQITEKDVSESMDEIRALPSVTPVACIAKITFNKDDIQKLVDEKVKEIVVERKKGHWILLDECSNSGYYCSKCHKKVVKEGWSDTVKKIKYCPNCGSFMITEN